MCSGATVDRGKGTDPEVIVSLGQHPKFISVARVATMVTPLSGDITMAEAGSHVSSDSLASVLFILRTHASTNIKYVYVPGCSTAMLLFCSSGITPGPTVPSLLESSNRE